jgi:hypothetical protein
MKTTGIKISCFLMLFCLQGCSPSLLQETSPTATISKITPDQTTGEPPHLPEVEVIQTQVLTSTPNPQISPTFTPSPSATPLPEGFQYSNYFLLADLDYLSGLISIVQTISYTNTTGSPITALPLFAEINRFPVSLSISRFEVVDHPLANYILNNNILIISFDSDPVNPLETLKLTIQYSFQVPKMHSEAGNGLFGKSQYQLNLFDWYFWLPAYSLEDGWLIHPPAGFAEHTSYPQANFDCLLSIENQPDGLVVTGSTDPLATNNSYHFLHSRARNLFISISPFFEVLEKSNEKVTVHSYFFPGHESAATVVLNASFDAIQIYGNTISPYHRSVLNIVETNLIDGMEGDGMYFLGSSFYDNSATNQSLLALLAVHETAHQWWYAAVADDQAISPWLDEGFATFTEGIYYENSPLADFTWWKNYRMAGNPSTEYINQPIYNFPYFRPYRNAVYLRGANFLIDLRAAMGEELFYRFLTEYFQNAASGQITNERIFFDTLADYFDINRLDFLNDYFPIEAITK